MKTTAHLEAAPVSVAEIPLQPNRAANVMCTWLERQDQHNRSTGVPGWRRVETAREAQELANQGHPVIVSQRRSGAGHVALVRPVPENATMSDDPYIAQSGATNTSLDRASSFFDPSDQLEPRNRVIYYTHP